MDHLQIPTVAVLGHDWGGLVAWRFAQFYPHRVEAGMEPIITSSRSCHLTHARYYSLVASFCTPYLVPNTEPITLQQFVEKLPNFTYQLHLVSPKAEEEINAHVSFFSAHLTLSIVSHGSVTSIDRGIFQTLLPSRRRFEGTHD